MPSTKEGLTRKRGIEGLKLTRGTTSFVPTPGLDALDGLEKLDDEVLQTLSLDAPIQLTPPPGNDSDPLSNDVMEATLKRLGFGPPDDFSKLPISISTTPTHSESSATGMSAAAAAPDPIPTTDESDIYGQILGLFQQISQKTGLSVNNLLLEFALLQAQTDLMKKRVACMPNALAARQHVFDEKAKEAVELGAKLDGLGIDFLFVMVGQNTTEGVSLGKVWSTPGLQGMFNDLSLSDDDLLSAARMHLYSSAWSRFTQKYKKGQMEPPVEGADNTTAPISKSSYIAKQSAVAANAFISASHKKGGNEQAIEGTPGQVSKPVKSEPSALSVLLGRD